MERRTVGEQWTVERGPRRCPRAAALPHTPAAPSDAARATSAFHISQGSAGGDETWRPKPKMRSVESVDRSAVDIDRAWSPTDRFPGGTTTSLAPCLALQAAQRPRMARQRVT